MVRATSIKGRIARAGHDAVVAFKGRAVVCTMHATRHKDAAILHTNGGRSRPDCSAGNATTASYLNGVCKHLKLSV